MSPQSAERVLQGASHVAVVGDPSRTWSAGTGECSGAAVVEDVMAWLSVQAEAAVTSRPGAVISGLRATLLGTSGTAIPNNAALIIAGPNNAALPVCGGVDTGLLVALRVHFFT